MPRACPPLVKSSRNRSDAMSSPSSARPSADADTSNFTLHPSFLRYPMSTPPALPRRNFLKTSTTLAASAALAAATPRFLTAAERRRSIGANDRIRIAQIGCGDRGCLAHLKDGILPHLAATNFEVVAIA